jgi:tetratricopeptide (TPR) repeat protein
MRIAEDRHTHMLQWCYNDMGKYYLWQFLQDTSVAYLRDSAFYFITKAVYLESNDDQSNKANLYSQAAISYWDAGLRDSAMLYSERALEIIPYLENSEAAIYYNNLGFAYSEAGVYDSALVFEQRALEADSTYLDTYTTLAEIYGYQHDRERFYYYLEKVFEKGYKGYTQEDLTDPIPPYTFYNKEERYKKLWEKYVSDK